MSKRKEKKRVSKEQFDKKMEFWNKVKVIKIGSDYYDLKILDKVQGGKCCGETDYDNRCINISKRSVEMDSLQPIATLFHEIAHGVVGTFTNADNEAKEDQIEFYVDFAAESLVMLMLDNTDLFRVILDRIEERKRKHIDGK